MHKISIFLDEENQNAFDSNNKKNRKAKIVKVNDDLFDIAYRKGLIEKVGDSYVFIGEYEELLAFKKQNQKVKPFELLE